MSKLITTALMDGAVIIGHPAGTVIKIYESDRVLYKNCEFRDLTIIFSKEISSHALHGCLLRDCKVLSEGGKSKSETLLGYNIMIGGTFNDEDVKEFRTNGGDR